MERSPEAEPWWLADEAECGFCLRRHATTAEGRCTGCDRAVCHECVVAVRGEAGSWCPECTPDAREGA